MEIRELTCINCPMGCALKVTLDNGEVVSVTGNTCPRGDTYGRSEVIHPVRMITSVLPVEGGDLAMVSCKTSQPVDKERIFDVMRAMEGVCIQAPVAIGDVLIANAANSGADIVATRSIAAKPHRPSGC